MDRMKPAAPEHPQGRQAVRPTGGYGATDQETDGRPGALSEQDTGRLT